MRLIGLKANSTYIIVNLSDQLQEGKNKSLSISDIGFVSLCAKDAAIQDISEMSQNCSGDSEINITACIGNSTGVTIEGINCIDEGSVITVSGLIHSALRGTLGIATDPVVETGETTTDTSSSAGGATTTLYCGDGFCSAKAGETCSSCAIDCGMCRFEGETSSIPDEKDNSTQSRENLFDNEGMNLTEDTSYLEEKIKEGINNGNWNWIIIPFCITLLLLSIWLFIVGKRKERKEEKNKDDDKIDTLSTNADVQEASAKTDSSEKNTPKEDIMPTKEKSSLGQTELEKIELRLDQIVKEGEKRKAELINKEKAESQKESNMEAQAEKVGSIPIEPSFKKGSGLKCEPDKNIIADDLIKEAQELAQIKEQSMILAHNEITYDTKELEYKKRDKKVMSGKKLRQNKKLKIIKKINKITVKAKLKKNS
jgi:hypothetical protein